MPTYRDADGNRYWFDQAPDPESVRADLVLTDDAEPPMPFADQQAAAHAAVRAAFTAASLAGFAYDFGGAIGTRRLDLRNADDKANWTLLLLKCQGMIAGGAGAATVQIRAQDNTTFDVPASDAATAMQAMLGWGGGLYTHKWALDDAIEAATTPEVLAAIDPAAGWPQ